MLRLVILLACVFGATGAFAADGSSGCGPGWYLFDDHSLLSSSLRNTTNNWLSPTVTFGMTSGTSNCKKHSFVEKSKRSLHFATENYHDLMVQAAQGNGEYLAAFADTLGCSWQAQDRFNAALQANYADIFFNGDATPEVMHENIIGTILGDRELASACLPPFSV